MKNKTFQIIIVVCLIIISFSVAYYFIIYLPNKDKQEKQEAEDKRLMQQEVQQYNEQQRLNSIKDCQLEAKQNAIELLKTKAKLNTSLYGEASKEEGIYLKPDYESYYKECLETKGIDI